MTKSLLPCDSVSEDQTLRATADLIIGRASAIAVPPAKSRALELARLVVRDAPGFGGRELNDAKIVEALKAEQIGVATFKKALSIARKDLAKKPTAARPRRATPHSDLPTPTPKTLPQAAGSSMAVNLDRTLL